MARPRGRPPAGEEDLSSVCAVQIPGQILWSARVTNAAGTVIVSREEFQTIAEALVLAGPCRIERAEEEEAPSSQSMQARPPADQKNGDNFCPTCRAANNMKKREA